MNVLNSLLGKFRGDGPAPVAISPIAHAVKQELERLSSNMYLDDEQYAAIEQQFLAGLSPAECAAELYPGLLSFDPCELPNRGPTAGKYNRLLNRQYHQIYHGDKGWELSAPTYLNILRAAQRLAPETFLPANCATWFLDPMIEKAGASNNPELVDALIALIDAVALSKENYAYLSGRDISKWLSAAGLSRDAVPALRALEKVADERLEERRRIIDAAPDMLGPVLEHAFESQISFYKMAKGHNPSIDAVIDAGPEERGRALQYLLDLVVDGDELLSFQHLGRKNGRWSNARSWHDAPQTHLDVIAHYFARFTHSLPDRDDTHVKLVALLTARHGRGGFISPSRQVLRELLKTVTEFSEGRTAAAMAELVKLGEYSDWRQPLEQALGKVASAGVGQADVSLELPEWVIGKHMQAENFAGHYANLFEPKLYENPHDSYMRAVIKLVHGQYAAEEAGDSPGKRKRLLAEELKSAGLLSEFDPADELSWHFTVDFLNTAVELCLLREAFRPMVVRHPDIIKDLAPLISKITRGAAPSQKWLGDVQAICQKVDASEWTACLAAIIQHDAPTSSGRANSGEPYVRAMIYIAAFLPPDEIGGMLAQYALKKCYVTEPGVGIRSEKLGNACVWTLSQMPGGGGVPYLARILARTRYPKIRKMIDTRLNAAAEKAGIARADLDEAMVPTHDLDADGKRTIAFEHGTAILVVDGNSARIEWTNAQGKPVKSATAAMKQDKDLMKDVRGELKELQSDLSIQPQRLQKLYLQDRSWSAQDWRERYLEHPLMRGFTRRLVWQVEEDGAEPVAAFPDADGQAMLTLSGEPVSLDNARLRLWHPMHGSVEQIEAWRDRLEELRVTQPFAQVWREIYALTDAERATGTYSNRWAAHILKQQQAMTLARLNGWTVTARMWVDAPNDAPWHLHLPDHGLVAQYWVEGAGGDDPEVTANGAYSFVNTDRVTFFAAEEGASDSAYGPGTGDPLPLADIPPVIFSEVMRSCDLFTAVASIAADPAWLDRGQDAAHPSQWGQNARRYWQDVNTGDLVESGKRRRAMLARIVPRLAIADKLTLTDRALVVKGTRHIYEIHLGSGACSHSGQHICIVPKSSSAGPKVWLPFEGDRTLSIIISKAVLLAADDKIADPVILAQI